MHFAHILPSIKLNGAQLYIFEIEAHEFPHHTHTYRQDKVGEKEILREQLKDNSARTHSAHINADAIELFELSIQKPSSATMASSSNVAIMT